jgi:beta-RFAP synthase
MLTGRAERSAVGTYGFVQGGLLLEEGKWTGEAISPSVKRVELPVAWRFVLITAQGQRGLAGEQERSAFRDLPPVPDTTSQQLYAVATEQLLPAARSADFAAFGEGLYRYGYQAGMCFAPRQGGPFASPRIGELVKMLRAAGVRGVGQSSWGPTVFALCESDAAARGLCDQLAEDLVEGERVLIARPNNTGATIRQLPGDDF